MNKSKKFKNNNEDLEEILSGETIRDGKNGVINPLEVEGSYTGKNSTGPIILRKFLIKNISRNICILGESGEGVGFIIKKCNYEKLEELKNELKELGYTSEVIDEIAKSNEAKSLSEQIENLVGELEAL